MVPLLLLRRVAAYGVAVTRRRMAAYGFAVTLTLNGCIWCCCDFNVEWLHMVLLGF